jgi:hypothetical protein
VAVPTPVTPPLTVVPSAEQRRRERRLNRTGVLLIVVGALLFVVPAAVTSGLCAFAPCSPLLPEVGFTLSADGRTAIETGPEAAADLQEVVVMSGADPTWGEAPVIWRVERTGDVPADWSGDVVLGEAPAGFEETVALTVPLTEGTAVGVANGCYYSAAPVPAGPLAPGVVTTEFGQHPVDEFRAANGGFTQCGPEDDPARPYVMTAIVLGLVAGAAAIGCFAVASFRNGPAHGRPARSGSGDPG